ncbi:MAG: AmmeMemoRadiSam system protein B [Burkholderiales bacterium]|nr:AmmeMemoRadiSam system protein B [Burkholderiales bacterium]MDE2454793.1 AmmeMemoRadiSam system protein B [Burkholderiales bacterium]
MSGVRPAVLAGSFYPAQPNELRHELAAHLARAAGAVGAPERPPKLIVVPHAGHAYSGDVAALAYAALARWRERIRRVVLLGPNHRVALRGLAAPTVDAFETPLGRVALDAAALHALESLEQVIWTDKPHAPEHSLEVQLPFLQQVLGSGFGLVPLLVGQAGAEEVAEVLERVWGGEETLVVVSSDLSHYQSDARARVTDAVTAGRILHFATDLRGEEACGAAALNGALLVARRHGLVPRLLGLATSADVPQGEAARVVGYGAIAFDPAPGVDDDAALGRVLPALARAAIGQALNQPTPAPAGDPSALNRPGACFVTLRDAAGRLRGCIGHLEASRALGADVRANALAAAFEDPRFAPLTAAEWPGLAIEVSVLDAPERIEAADEAAALAALRPGEDGLILEWRGARATLLPQVWQDYPEPAQFMAALKRKARLPAAFWSDDLQLWRYRVRSFGEGASHPARIGTP